MRSLLARLAVLGAFALSISACSGGNGSALPFAGPPNNAGGSPGTIQSGGNNLTLLRFVQGAPPDPATKFSGTVDVCVDNLPITITNPVVSYGQASGLYEIPGGITHTVAVYQSLGTPTPVNAGAGAECPTAPGPYFGLPPLFVTTISTATANNRITVVLGGTASSGTFGLYVFQEPSFAVTPAGAEVITHNAAPAFSKGKSGVGFGICTTTVTPCATPVALLGAQNEAAPKPSAVNATTLNPIVISPLNSIPPGFYDGAGVPTGNPVPITSIAAPNSVAGQPYVLNLYAIDAAAGGLNLIGVPEQTLGVGF